MKAHLMYRNADIAPERAPLPLEVELVQDLELTTLFAAMAGGDQFLYDVAQDAVLTNLDSTDAISFRQAILVDCIQQPEVIRRMYTIAIEAIGAEKKVFGGYFRWRPAQALSRSVEVIEALLDPLKELRQIADDSTGQFRSDGLTTLFDLLRRELDDEYFRTVRAHLKRLRFRDGVLMSAELGTGNKAAHYVLRTPGLTRRSWKEWLGLRERSSYSFEIPPRDEAGAVALSELRDRGIDPVANALAQSADHIVSFMVMLRTELAFYVGCLNLRDLLQERGESTCFPVPLPVDADCLAFTGLKDVSLALVTHAVVVGNDTSADGVNLLMTTGANSGGKSTFLRSLGLAQLMMQCGMFVLAERFSANLCTGVFTHFVREEDASMASGRLDDELSRMSAIVEAASSRSLVLFNESFASTNEREGSEIARQLVRALLETGMKVCYVTHLYDLAEGFWDERTPTMQFLVAPRREDGQRSFKLEQGEPLPTSFGVDLYERMGGF